MNTKHRALHHTPEPRQGCRSRPVVARMRRHSRARMPAQEWSNGRTESQRRHCLAIEADVNNIPEHSGNHLPAEYCIMDDATFHGRFFFIHERCRHRSLPRPTPWMQGALRSPYRPTVCYTRMRFTVHTRPQPPARASAALCHRSMDGVMAPISATPDWKRTTMIPLKTAWMIIPGTSDRVR